MSSTVDELVAQLRDGGSRVTTARRLVLTALVKGAHHPTAEELLVAVRALAPDVHASTVYRNLEELERLGVVVHTHLGHGAATYHLATEAHGHLVCEVCGKVSDIPAHELDDLVARLHDHYGFELEPSRFALLGQCSEHGAESALAVGAQGAPPDGTVGLESVG